MIKTNGKIKRTVYYINFGDNGKYRGECALFNKRFENHL